MNINRSKKILVVDDVSENIKVVGELFRHKHTVLAAKNGKLALELLKRVTPDLILLDIEMPEIDGYEVCRIIKSDPKTASIPIIFVTAKGAEVDEQYGFDLGAVDYITKPFSAEILRRRVETHLSLVSAEEITRVAKASILMLGQAGHYNDTDTGVHIWRMASFAKAVAVAAGWSEGDAGQLEMAAPMHDTGKIGIPHAILKAPRKLTPEEWDVMKTHSQLGYDILSKADHPLFNLAAEVALGHHEKWDGSGYPSGLSGEDIPEAARIVAIADVFDALTSKRAYKSAWTIDDAFAEIQLLAGSHFDPRLVDLFVGIRDEIVKIKEGWDRYENEDESAIFDSKIFTNQDA